jgi:hypothetical protein
MKQKEKFEMLVESLNRLGCGEVQIDKRKHWNGTIETEANLFVGPNLITVLFRPAGYLHPRTSCKVLAYVRGKKTSLDHAIGVIRASIKTI